MLPVRSLARSHPPPVPGTETTSTTTTDRAGEVTVDGATRAITATLVFSPTYPNGLLEAPTFSHSKRTFSRS